MKTKELLMYVLLLFHWGCGSRSNDSGKLINYSQTSPRVENTDTPSISETQAIESSQMAKLNIALKEKGYFLIGVDSIIRHLTVNDCVVLNGMKRTIFITKKEKYIFESPKTCIEYLYKRKQNGKTINSMRIVQLYFSSDSEATNWESIYKNSPFKQIIEDKPRTGIYKTVNTIYVVQTYFDGGSRNMLNDILGILMKQ